MVSQTYSIKEITSNINTLTKQQEDLILQRNDINRAISEKRKAIKYWEELDPSQLKAF